MSIVARLQASDGEAKWPSGGEHMLKMTIAFDYTLKPQQDRKKDQKDHGKIYISFLLGGQIDAKVVWF
jgi:hypothetical protein